MSKASTLYELQKLDLEIEAREKDLAQVIERLGDDSALQERREALAEVRSDAKALEKRRQSLHTQASDLQGKIVPVEKKLYGGQVKIPKELVALQQDVEMLKGQRRQLEDAELEVMLQLDEAQRQEREGARELREMERQWDVEQKGLSSARDTLSAELEALRGQREALAGQVDPVSLDTYQRIRTNKQGLAVASLERGTCLGCRINVPSIEVQRARSGRELVLCQSCGRVLFVP